MDKSNKHIPVLISESVKYLDIKKDGVYIDCTFGRGGHSSEILKLLSEKGRVIAIDRDVDAVKYFQEEFKNDKRISIVHDKFSNIKNILISLGIDKVDGILYDLGVSSPQLDNKERGFSYHGNNFLDMRMNQNEELTASKILKTYSKKELINVFYKYGDINNSGKVVESIIDERDNLEEFTTAKFVEIIKANSHPKELYKNKHPARKYFQALRIVVNDEISEIEKSLEDVKEFVRVNGRIVVITFHSLEDKIVKNKFKQFSENKIPKEVPIFTKSEFKVIKTTYKPEENEINQNNRSRSSRIRCIERVYEY